MADDFMWFCAGLVLFVLGLLVVIFGGVAVVKGVQLSDLAWHRMFP